MLLACARPAVESALPQGLTWNDITKLIEIIRSMRAPTDYKPILASDSQNRATSSASVSIAGASSLDEAFCAAQFLKLLANPEGYINAEMHNVEVRAVAVKLAVANLRMRQVDEGKYRKQTVEDFLQGKVQELLLLSPAPRARLLAAVVSLLHH